MGEETKTVTKDTLGAIFKSDEEWKTYPTEKRILSRKLNGWVG